IDGPDRRSERQQLDRATIGGVREPQLAAVLEEQPATVAQQARALAVGGEPLVKGALQVVQEDPGGGPIGLATHPRKVRAVVRPASGLEARPVGQRRQWHERALARGLGEIEQPCRRNAWNSETRAVRGPLREPLGPALGVGDLLEAAAVRPYVPD